MVRACKALLCALAADVATVSFAIRSNAGVEKSSAVSHVMDKIGSLLQTRGYSMLSKLRITPGATESLNDALSKVISEIGTNVESKIIQGHKQTQAAINQQVDNVKAATTKAVAQKVVADRFDGNWSSCVRNEKVLRVAIEEAEAATQSSRSGVGEPCQLQEDNKMFNAKPEPADLKFECDISKNGNCDSQTNNYESQVNSFLDGMRSDAAAASERWAAAKAACDAAKEDVVKKQSAANSAVEAWTSMRDECLKKHEARHLSMCLFGTDLQSKCEQVGAYSSLLGDAKKEGGVHSNLDRIKEWKAAVVTKCMLQKIIDGGEIDAQTLEGCEGSVSFDSDVGVLDEQGTEFQEQTSPDKFTCLESKIKFTGSTWVVPDSADAASSDYFMQDYEPAVDLTGGSAPFDFCNAEKETCASYDCKVGKNRNRETVCAAQCTDAECC